ncbi:hypothetical protein H6G10_22920 [Anabaena cylindrica FACHB-170]|uniref:hypothetical protein n=1 Tax=Anabaena cylindrica TaxID=1165 RepID=UPI00168ABD7F|nr:hypothetical protein [Anabaena cylindrica]MBD2286022.1 hypothetical protein [Anabaena cylindrica FACHB-170]
MESILPLRYSLIAEISLQVGITNASHQTTLVNAISGISHPFNYALCMMDLWSVSSENIAQTLCLPSTK